jgi:hypothetical protein
MIVRFGVWKSAVALCGCATFAALLVTGCAGDSKGGGGGGGSEPQATENASVPQDSVVAFEETVFPIVRDNCQVCHGASQAPQFAVEDVKVAHDNLVKASKVDLNHPDASRIYLKVKEGHNCWSDCAENSGEILASIEDWASRIAKEEEDATKTKELTYAQGKVGKPSYVPDPKTFVVEAESGALSGGMAKVAMPATSGGNAIGVANGLGQDVVTAANAMDVAIFTFDVTVPGDYRVFAKGSAPANPDNQVFMRIDSQPLQSWAFTLTEPGAFAWEPARGGTVELAPVALTAGKHTVEFRRHEAGFFLDLVALTADPDFNNGAPRESTVSLLSYDVSAMCGGAATFEIEVVDFNSGAYKLKYPRIKPKKGQARLKGINLFVNGKENPQYATFKLVDATVKAGDSNEGVLSKGAMVVIKEQGIKKDTFAFSFDECEVK